MSSSRRGGCSRIPTPLAAWALISASFRKSQRMVKPGPEPVEFGKDADGRSVLTAVAAVPRMNWFVFFEQPLSTVLQPVYSLLFRIAWLLVVGVLLAVLVGVLMARQMVVPIRALQIGAQQLEASDFGHRIDVKTGDEIEDLADYFNRMADQLRDPTAGWSKRSRNVPAISRSRSVS